MALDVQPRLGVDIGGVIAPPASSARLAAALHDDGEDTHLDGATTPPIEGAMEALLKLEPVFGRHRYLVSKAGAFVERGTIGWLRDVRFHQVTGIPKKNVHFCTCAP